MAALKNIIDAITGAITGPGAKQAATPPVPPGGVARGVAAGVAPAAPSPAQVMPSTPPAAAAGQAVPPPTGAARAGAEAVMVPAKPGADGMVQPPSLAAQVPVPALDAPAVGQSTRPGNPLFDATMSRFTGRNAEKDMALKAGYGIDGIFETQAQGIDFNMAKIAAPDDVKNWIDDLSATHPDLFDTRKRGVRTFAQIAGAADALSMTPDDVLAMRGIRGEEWQKAWAVALGKAVEIKSIAQKAAQTGDVTDLLAARTAMTEAASLVLHLKGEQTELARTQASNRMMRKALTGTIGEVNDMLETFGGIGVNRRWAAMVAQVDDPAKVLKLAAKSRNPTAWDMLKEAWYNSMLSSPYTHMVNLVSSLGAHAYSTPEHMTAAVMGSVRRALGGQADGVYMQEVMAGLTGLDGMREAALKAWRTLRHGEASDLATKFDQGALTRQPAITAANVTNLMPRALGKSFLLPEGTGRAAAFDLAATWLVRGPSRFMATEDELVKGLSYDANLRRLAMRQAIVEGAPDPWARMKTLYDNADTMLPKDVHEQAFAAAREATFQDKSGAIVGAMSHGMASLEETVKTLPAGAQLMAAPAAFLPRMIVPFIRTPVNVFKYAAKRSPLALAMPDAFWGEIAAGGARADMAMGRLTLGTSIAAGIVPLAAGGYITGSGPLDPKAQKDRRDLLGIPEYSIFIPATSPLGKSMGLTEDIGPIQYKRADPFAMVLGAVADYVDIAGYATEEERGVLASAIGVSIYRNMVSRTYLSGVADFFDMANQAESGSLGAVERFMARAAGSPLIPAAVPWAEGVYRAMTDQGQKPRAVTTSETAALAASRPSEGLVDDATLSLQSLIERTVNTVKARMPGENGMPPALNFWGEEVTYPPGMGYNVFPLFMGKAKFDANALVDLGINPMRWTDVRAGPQTAGLDQLSFSRFIDAVGPAGETLRLGASLGLHGDSIGGVKLTPWEEHDYIRAINETPAQDGEVIAIHTGDGGTLPLDISGLRLKQALTALMKTPEYWEAPDDPEASASKMGMVRRVLSVYRHDMNRDPARRDGIAGADAVILDASPELQQRVFLRRMRTLPPAQLERMN